MQDSSLEEFKEIFVQEVSNHNFFKIFKDLVISKKPEELRKCFNENGGIFISSSRSSRYIDRNVYQIGLMSVDSEFPLTRMVLQKIKVMEK
jgi:hypothetical protein